MGNTRIHNADFLAGRPALIYNADILEVDRDYFLTATTTATPAATLAATPAVTSTFTLRLGIFILLCLTFTPIQFETIFDKGLEGVFADKVNKYFEAHWHLMIPAGCRKGQVYNQV